MLSFTKQCIAFAALSLASVLWADTSKVSTSIFIESIQCKGAVRTSCADLVKILGIQPKSTISEDELSALDAKLAQIGFYSEYSVSLEPLQESRHANLHLKLQEKETARHGILTRGFLGWGPLPSFTQYSYTDTNFLGKGNFFHGAVSSKIIFSDLKEGADPLKKVQNLNSFNLEMATPLQDAAIGSVRFLTPDSSQSERILGFFGYGINAGYNSALTAYLGNAVGGNFSFSTEDNSFIPKSGVKFSATYLYALHSKKDDFGLDSRATIQWGRVSSYDGALTLGLVSRPHLNPTFYSYEGQQLSSPFPEGGLTYSLIKTENNYRSAFYLGMGSAGAFFDRDYLVFHAGYKAAFEHIDLNLGIIVAKERH